MFLMVFYVMGRSLSVTVCHISSVINLIAFSSGMLHSSLVTSDVVAT